MEGLDTGEPARSAERAAQGSPGPSSTVQSRVAGAIASALARPAIDLETLIDIKSGTGRVRDRLMVPILLALRRERERPSPRPYCIGGRRAS